MILNNDNYFSKEANREFFSVSQYKSFLECEAMAMAKIDGIFVEEKSTALLVGSYVDSYFEGTLDVFRNENPDIFTQKGALKADYKKADNIIARIERDPLFMKTLSGKKQVIKTAEMFGAKWKIKIDSLLENTAIVDLKIVKEITEKFFVREHGKGKYISFVENWGYDIQGAVYQEVYRLSTGIKLPFFLSVADKTPYPDIEILAIDDESLSNKLEEVEQNLARLIAVKMGEIEPKRCGVCDYCKNTKVLTAPIHFRDLVLV